MNGQMTDYRWLMVDGEWMDGYMDGQTDGGWIDG